MPAININEDVYLNNVCEFFSDNKDWYLKRFGYAACELWLCSEICNILNYDNNFAFAKSDSNMFCFNEDNKHDLTIYRNTENGQAKVLSHIEVKLLYPAYQKSKKIDKIRSLVRKLSSDSNKPGNSGWIFMIWTSANAGYYKESNTFFNDAFDDVKTYLYINHNDYAISELGMIDILGGVFDWRGGEKEIIVKAISINHISELY